MKICQFNLFLHPTLSTVFANYSSIGEQSLAKNVPMSLLADVQRELRSLGRLENARFRCVFRGSRSGYQRAYALKSNAKSFSIYRKY